MNIPVVRSLCCCSLVGLVMIVNGFSSQQDICLRIRSKNKPTYTISSLNVYNPNTFGRKGISLPILDFSSESSDVKVVTPLPSSHLPEDLTSLNFYGMELSRPIHKMLIGELIDSSKIDMNILSSPLSGLASFGHIAIRNNNSLVGAIGCSGEILLRTLQQDVEDNSEIGEDSPIMVLYRGCYRFIVREVIKTIPYPVVIVDEIFDEENSNRTSNNITDNKDSLTLMSIDDDDDDQLQYYSDASPEELKERIMKTVRTYIDFKLDEVSREADNNAASTLLERSILENSGIVTSSPADRRSQIEESAAVFDVFSSSLIDFAITPREQNFAIAMIAAEIISIDEDLRRKILTMTDSVRRLRLICKTAEETVSMMRARKVATEIAALSEDEEEKDLKVGPPQLPPWASQISMGTRIEYYWNEEYGWSPAEVVEEPLKIMDELLITVRFDADGEIHRLPLNPDEKIRWRPAGFGENK